MRSRSSGPPLRPHALLALASLLALTSMLAAPARAAWPSDPTVNVKVPFGYEGETHGTQCAVPDSGGGMIVFGSSSTAHHMTTLAQRIDWLGRGRWGSEGVVISARPSYYTLAVPDAAGGAYLALYDNETIALQHAGPDGTRWPSAYTFLGGVTIATVPLDLYHCPQTALDGAGGAIVVWSSTRAPGGLWAQRMSVAGTPVWTAGGVPLQATSLTSLPTWWQVASDGTGGAVVIATTAGSGGTGVDLRALSIRADGSLRSPTAGVVVCDAPGTQGRLEATGFKSLLVSSVPVAGGGMIVVWGDTRSDAAGDLYAQRVDSLGLSLWTADGVPVCTAAGAQSWPKVVSDGSGGVIVSWSDARDGATGPDLYAQRISADGTPLWATGGVPVCAAPGNQDEHVIVPRASGGAIVAWSDKRASDQGDIFAQAIDGAGVPLWALDGAPVCIANDDPVTERSIQNGPVLAADDHDGAIAAWSDYRTGGYEIFAQYVPLEQGALLGVEPPALTLGPLARLRVAPNPALASARVAFARDASAHAALELLDIAGRLVRTRDLSALAPGTREVMLDGLGGLPAGVYLVRVRQGEAIDMTKLLITH
jgi:hypothetical protein